MGIAICGKDIMTRENKKRALKKCVFYVLLFLIFYLSSYSILSFYGGYYPAKTGNYRLNMGWSLVDVEMWRPKIGYAQIYRKVNGNLTMHADWVGLIYCPLILFDQKYIHKTKYLNQYDQKESQY